MCLHVVTNVGLVLLFYDTSGVMVCNDFVAHYKALSEY